MRWGRGRRVRVELVYGFGHSPLAYVSRRARLRRMWGSEALRLQLREAMRPHLPEHIELAVSGLSFGNPRARRWWFRSWIRTRRPALFILLKHAGYRLLPHELDALRRKAIAIGVDHNDANPGNLDLGRFDFHVSASETGRRAIDALLDAMPAGAARPAAEVWHQTFDRRLEAVPSAAPDRLAPVYVGHPDNAAIPPALADRIAVLPVQRNEEMARAVPQMGRFNLHYAVRPYPAEGLARPCKPFTKGFNAAVCGANILVNRQVDDAVEFLGADYPYLLQGNGAAEVEAGFRKAEAEFGGPEWQRGLEIMRAVRARVSAPVLARDFAAMVDRLV